MLFADQAEFFDANGINEPRNTTYERLAELSGAVKTELPNQLQVRDKLGPHGSLNSGNAVTNDLKVIVEMARLVGGPCKSDGAMALWRIPYQAAGRRRSGRSGCRKSATGERLGSVYDEGVIGRKDLELQLNRGGLRSQTEVSLWQPSTVLVA